MLLIEWIEQEVAAKDKRLNDRLRNFVAHFISNKTVSFITNSVIF